MTIQMTLRRQFFVAILVASAIMRVMSATAEWRPLPDELVNRPVGQFLCGPDGAACEHGM